MSDHDALGLLVDELGTRARLPWRGVRLWGQPWRLSRGQAVDRVIAAAGAPEARELQRHSDLFQVRA